MEHYMHDSNDIRTVSNDNPGDRDTIGTIKEMDSPPSGLTDEHYQFIFEIMDEFDFEKVALVMEHLNWSWAGAQKNDVGNIAFSTPDIKVIKKTARELLIDIAKRCVREPGTFPALATGGLRVEGSLYNDGFLWLRLSFEIDSIDNG